MALYVKLWTDILGDEKLMRAARKGAKHLHLLPWLIVFAKRVDDEGHLAINGEVADPEDIAALIPGVKAKQVAGCIAELHDLGVLEEDGNGGFRFANWQARTGPAKPSDKPEATRNRKRRSRAGHARDNDESRGYTHSQEQETEPEIEQKGEKESSSSSALPLTDSAVKLVSMLGDTDHAEQTVVGFLAGLPNDAKRHSWALSLIAGLEGIGGPLILAGPLLDGMADFNLADRQQFPYNAAVFRAFVDRAARPKLERTGPLAKPVTDALDQWAKDNDAKERKHA